MPHTSTHLGGKKIGKGVAPKDFQLKRVANFGSFGNVANYKLGHRERAPSRNFRLADLNAPTYPHSRNTRAHQHFGTKQDMTDGYRKGEDGLAGNDMKATNQARTDTGKKYMTWKGKGIRNMRNVG